MAGTKAGGRLAAKRNKERDPDFYRKIGKVGGTISRNGGFASDKVGPDGMTGRERARIAGYWGGKVRKDGSQRIKVNVIPKEENNG